LYYGIPARSIGYYYIKSTRASVSVTFTGLRAFIILKVLRRHSSTRKKKRVDFVFIKVYV
jgi:hypothetical protein